jgi:serine/threonine protein kinase/tetratricopeptide (TPR) repeat protein
MARPRRRTWARLARDTRRGDQSRIAAFMTAKELFLAASELPLDQRTAFLDAQCAGDPALRAAVEALLAAEQSAGAFLAGPTLEPSVSTPPTTGIPTPRQIGHYKLLQEIGEGGFGTVWLAEQEQPVRRRVALKVIKLGMDTRQVIARFEAERQALAIMDHPNIARVFDAGATDNGRPFFVMELVKGEPITVYCDRNNLSIRQRLELFAQVCQAIQHAHQKGIIHRDIKPSNVLVSTQDERPLAKVIDFGIAKATQSRLTEKTLFTEFRQLIGTPESMSPEQAGGSLDIDTRTDIYSLGVLLYELLTGTPPFDPRELRSKAYGEIQRVIREVDPPRPSTRLSTMQDALPSVAARRQVEPRKLNTIIRGELDWIVMRCLEKDRTRRYETANGVVADVLHYLANEPVSAGPPGAAYRIRKFIRRHRATVTLSAAALLLIVAGTALYVRSIRAEQARTRAALTEANAQRDEAERQKRQVQQANENTQAVNKFLTDDIIGAADPDVAQGKEISVKEAVDKASATVRERFVDRPLIEAAVRNAVAATYYSLGRADLGLPHAQAALQIRRRLLGNDHPDTLTSINHLGLLLRAQGNLDEAEKLWTEAVETARRTLGRGHPDTIMWTYDLGYLIQDRGKLPEAEALFRDVLDRSRRVIGEDDKRTIAAENQLGAVLMKEDKLDEAEPLLVDALARRRRVLGEDHPETLYSINDLGRLRQAQGKLDEAEQLTRESLERHRRVLGPEHRNTLMVLNNVASVLMSRGRLEEAEKLFREALDISRRTSGIDNPRTLGLLSNLALALKDERKFDEAEPMLRESIARYRTVLGDDHHRTIAMIDKLEDLHEQQGRLAEAEPLAAEVYHKAPRGGFSEAELIGVAAKYGVLLTKLGRFSEAEKPLLDAQNRLRAAGRRQGKAVDDVWDSLAKVYDATGRPQDAARLRSELATMKATTRAAATTQTATTQAR